MKAKQTPANKVLGLSRLIDSVCGIYSRIARRLGVHRTYVSRVARGERHSPAVETALLAEYDRIQKTETGPLQE